MGSYALLVDNTEIQNTNLLQLLIDHGLIGVIRITMSS